MNIYMPCRGWTWICLILAGSLSSVGCGLLETRPSAEVVGVSLTDVSLTDATLAFDVEITNPYDVPLPMVNVDYALARQGGDPFLRGEAPLQGTVPAGASKVVQVPARVNFGDAIAAMSGVRLGDVVDYAAEMGFSVDAPVLGALRLPVRKQGQLPIPTAPTVSIQRVSWDQLRLQQASGTIELAVSNPNQFPLDLEKMDLRIEVGDVELLDAAIEKAVSLAAAGGSDTIRIPVRLTPANLGMGAFNVLTGRGASYDLKGSFRVATPFAPMTFPVSATGNTIFQR